MFATTTFLVRISAVITPDAQRKKWDHRSRDPTFTKLAGSLAFLIPETPNEPPKRRETIFEEALRRNVPAFHGKLHSLRFSEIN
jgi:hypothetical protein